MRAFEFTYAATVTDMKPGQTARIWLPVPPSNEEQKVEIVKKDLPVEGRIQTARPHGNRILYLEAKANASGEISVRLKYRVKRRELTRDRPARGGEDAKELARLLEANRRVPISGKPLELLKGKKVPVEEMEAARFFYDLVNRHMRYSKEGTGWGQGDSVWACENGRGNCTDFHSLFISLTRAQHIPAQFEIGFLLPPETRLRRDRRLSLLGEVPLAFRHLVPRGHFRGQQKPTAARLLFRQFDRRSRHVQHRPRSDAPAASGRPACQLLHLSLR